MDAITNTLGVQLSQEVVVAGLLAASVVFLWARSKPQVQYPAGPKGWPLIGNIPQIPLVNPWLVYNKWARELDSDVVHLYLAGAHLVVIDTVEAANELLDKRSAMYSDRPRLTMLTELSQLNWSFVFMRYGAIWRQHRKLMRQHFNNSVIPKYEPHQLKATHEHLYRLLNKPEDFYDLTALMSGSLIISISYGMDVQSADDPYLELINGTVKVAEEAVAAGAFLVDVFPSLQHLPDWVPGTGFKRTARQWARIVQTTATTPLEWVKDNLARDVDNQSIAAALLASPAASDEDARGVAATVYAAGFETTTSTLYCVMLDLTLFPEAVKKAQEEIDRVVGEDRLPTFEDRDSLPYVTAVVREALRWNPAVPLDIPHRLMQDDVYNGKVMPEGTILIANHWAMLHNENDYPEPEKFNPDRFLKDGKLNPDIRAPEDVGFGFGRRACPGREFAMSTLFINVASLLAVFDISKAVDAKGVTIEPKQDYDTGFINRPKPFPCSIKPRSARAAELIKSSYAVYHP